MPTCQVEERMYCDSTRPTNRYGPSRALIGTGGQAEVCRDEMPWKRGGSCLHGNPGSYSHRPRQHIHLLVEAPGWQHKPIPEPRSIIFKTSTVSRYSMASATGVSEARPTSVSDTGEDEPLLGRQGDVRQEDDQHILGNLITGKIRKSWADSRHGTRHRR
jgi:hypothetical protein